jgi:hypothetical protein
MDSIDLLMTVLFSVTLFYMGHIIQLKIERNDKILELKKKKLTDSVDASVPMEHSQNTKSLETVANEVQPPLLADGIPWIIYNQQFLVITFLLFFIMFFSIHLLTKKQSED